MSSDGRKDAPPYMVPVDGQGDGVKVYHVHTPFTPPESNHQQLPVYTGGLNSSAPENDGKNKYVSYDTALGYNPGMATCTSCQQQVMTNVTYKAGRYAWLMCLLFICLGFVCVVFIGLTDRAVVSLLCVLLLSLVLCCCLIPFFMNKFKDAYHTCPRCNRVLHIEKRKCCK
uniref:LITAF domain-containing protein n=1 Tax=Knipowitschia caucasica TaxID=637954 RepID=A0AAV2KIX1_KNICA